MYGMVPQVLRARLDWTIVESEFHTMKLYIRHSMSEMMIP